MKCVNLNFNSKIPEKYLEIKSKLKHFPCGEFEFSIQENISNEEITIFQSFKVGKFNDDLMKLKIVCDVLKRNNVKKIIYFAPFLPYIRQDKIDDKKSSFGLKIIAEILNNCKINELITYDLHSLQIEDFFQGKLTNLSMIPAFIEDIKQKFTLEEVAIVFPDNGSIYRSKKFFIDEMFDIGIINKNRIENKMEMKISGNIKNKIAIIIDDMIDTGKTIAEAIKILKQNDINSIFIYATHGIFSSNEITEIKIQEIVISNSIYRRNNKIKIISLKI
jgi:ribose-phosphate pyrophosphokinase